MAVAVATAFPLAGCMGDESGSDPDDGGDQTADTGPTTPEQTALETETPPMPSDTNFQRTATTGPEATAAPGTTDADTSEAESETGVAATSAAAAGALQLSSPEDGALKFEPETLDAPAGTVTIVYTNPSAVPHNVALENEQGEVVTDGGTSEVTAELQPGTYQYFCSVPGHREAGMSGNLNVG
jgi:plastocyanin